MKHERCRNHHNCRNREEISRNFRSVSGENTRRQMFIRVTTGLKTSVCKAELDSLEKDNVITKVEKSDWGSLLVPIVKPHGSVRLCVDYKATVNPRLVECHYPIPKIDELINQLRESRYYCKIDLIKAYLHVEMDSESAKIQSISTHRGTYRMNRLAFGIKSAPGQ